MYFYSKTAQPLVHTPQALRRLIDQLRRQPRFALDTESNSLYSYQGKVCLIQISVAAADDPPEQTVVEDYLVDPLRLNDLSPLGELLADPAVEVVMHAADNDMLTLYRSHGFIFQRVFDTQLAARILGWKQVGLAAILEEQFGIVSDKRMQRTDWGQRPLTPAQIAYAQMDTHSLLPLRERLVEALQQRGRWEEAQDAFAALTRGNLAEREPNGRSFWQMRSVREVPRGQHNVLEALWHWREQAARSADRPPFKVLNDSVLVQLAQSLPGCQDELVRIDGLSTLQIHRYGSELLDTIRASQGQPLPPFPSGDGRSELLLDKAIQQRYDDLRRWRTETAVARGVDADIVLPNSTLLAIAQQNPVSAEALRSIAGLTPWKIQSYAPPILAVLHQSAALGD